MTIRARRCFTLTLLLAGLVVSGATAAPPAGAASPWWHLSLGSTPASLQPGTAKSEEQELIVAPGTAFELKVAGNSIGLFESEPFPLSAFPSATPANIQTALETAYGPGNVIVSGGPGGEAPLKIVSVAGGADKAVAPLEVGISLGGSVEAKVLSKGSPDGTIVVTASNLGDADTDGAKTPVRLTDVLPAGLEAVAVEARAETRDAGEGGARLACSLGSPGKALGCSTSVVVPSYGEIELVISVVDKGASSGAVNQASVSGGGAQDISATRAVAIGATPVQFGVENYEMGPEEEGGALDTQAGSHPFQLTTTLTLNQGSVPNRPPALAKDLNFKLPPGLIGNPTPFPQCTDPQFLNSENFVDECPNKTAVGVAAVTIDIPTITPLGPVTVFVPLFNLQPNVGEPARFGFDALNVPVILDTSVRTGGDYGVTVSVENITQTATFLGSRVTFWGVPGDPSHDHARGWSCVGDEIYRTSVPSLPGCTPLSEQHPQPFLALPTSCTGPLQTSVEADSWQQEGAFASFPTSEPLPALDGCNQLPFSPQIEVAPDGQAASTPTGLKVDVHVPQDVNTNAAGLASSNVRDIAVQFPQGVTVNPASADGLLACSESQVGFEGGAGAQGELLFSATLPEAFCPDASKIGTVEIKSPLLPAGQPLEGALYLAKPAPNGEAGNNPFDSLLAVYIVAEDPISGTLVKLPGKIALDPTTGRITSTFENTPQLAFEDAKIHLLGGARAPLSTPATCGIQTTEATFTPWSGTAPVRSTSTFEVTSGPNGAPCPGAGVGGLPFTPTLAAGTTNINAGAFTPLTTTITREDGQQNIQTVQLHMPAGLSGILAHVPLCPEAQANAGTCGQGSKIGSTIVSVGLGGDPYTVTGGEVFLTEKYEGAPFGLSIVNPAVAGPFNLGKVIVRARIEVDPHTAELTITTGDIPHILDGIPLQIKHVNVTIERPGGGFTFNPTNCSPLAITGTIGSTEEAHSPVSVPFQVTNCAALKFAPKFSVSTAGKTSKAHGASLTAKLSYPVAAQGTQANITRVKVDLPKQLPSRLTTLQKACTSAQFELNPANCPKESKIGFAKVTTPLLPVPLEGPAIFVSHGGEAFPSLTMVLQGYGVTVDLVGTTFISKAGITSTTFKTVPDVPFNTFTLTLPQGKFSALAANLPAKAHGSFCGQTLKMPTEFLAQNGAKINESTKVGVTGCVKVKALTRQQKLTATLKACHRQVKGRRGSCEAAARRKYGAAKAKKRG